MLYAMPTRILIVDDEPAVIDLLAYNLRREHYDVRSASNGREALRLAKETLPDLILLDLMLPGVDGLEICRELRKNSAVPIIMITARGEEIDRVVGLELGADDYICKPFSVRELLARVKAVLRRTQSASTGIETGEILRGPNHLKLNTETRIVTIGNTTLHFTRLEFDLLYHLLVNAGRVISRETLLETVWGYDFAGDTRAVDSAIKRLRAKLRSAWNKSGETDETNLIESVRGIGYRLKRWQQ